MNIIISNHSDIPIYQQIVDHIRQNIVDGILSSGDALPSIRLLAKELSVSVITTKKAYEILEEQGYIKTVAGKGSFVSKQSITLAKEHKTSDLEQHLLAAIDIASELHMSKDEIKDLLDMLYTEV